MSLSTAEIDDQPGPAINTAIDAVDMPVLTSTEIDNIIERLRVNLQVCNEESTAGYELSLSIGWVIIDHRNGASIEVLMAQADRAMYRSGLSPFIVILGFRGILLRLVFLVRGHNFAWFLRRPFVVISFLGKRAC